MIVYYIDSTIEMIAMIVKIIKLILNYIRHKEAKQC